MFLLWPIRLVFRLVELVVVAAIVYVVISAVQVTLAADTTSSSPPGPFRAIVVVDPDASTSGIPSNLAARFAEAAELRSTSPTAPVILAGVGAAANSVATSAGSAYLATHGVPGGASSTVTGGNVEGAMAAVSAAVGKDARVVIVTDAIDSLFTSHAASAAGLDPVVSSPSTSKMLVFDELGSLWHEATGVAVGRIIGFDHVGWAVGVYGSSLVASSSTHSGVV